MKVSIIGIDGLEYDLVEELNLRNIKQVEYGKVIEPHSILLTPLLWASFITGSLNHGVKSFTVRRNPIIKFGGSMFEKLGIHGHASPRRFVRKGLMKLGLSTSPVDKRDLQTRTIFDYAKNPVAISIPAYNEWQSIHNMRLKYPFVKLVGEHNEKKATECIETNWRIFRRKLNYTLSLLEERDWDLLMVHFLILDTIGHLYWYKPGKLRDAYRYVNNLVDKFLSKIKDQWVLIVSDHGMKKGVHTNYAFYSTNIPLGLKNPKLTDFHDIILEKLHS